VDNDDAASGSGSDSDSDEDELVTALAQTTLADAAWPSSPAYAPLYLSTCAEYLPPPPKEKRKISVDDDVGDGKAGGGFALEGYEHSLATDAVSELVPARG
jgi:pre-rRNA-processing protein TSR4